MGLLLNDREKLLFDQRNIEVLRLAGADDVILWSKAVNPYGVPALLGNSVSGVPAIDCLYGEPNATIASTVIGQQHGYYRGYSVLGLFEEPSVTFDLTLLGGEQIYDSIMWFSRADLESRKIPVDDTRDYVKAGDIVELFSKSKGYSLYIEIINANRTGFIHDAKTWTQYKCECVRSTAIPPESKIP